MTDAGLPEPPPGLLLKLSLLCFGLPLLAFVVVLPAIDEAPASVQFAAVALVLFAVALVAKALLRLGLSEALRPFDPVRGPNEMAD